MCLQRGGDACSECGCQVMPTWCPYLYADLYSSSTGNLTQWTYLVIEAKLYSAILIHPWKARILHKHVTQMLCGRLRCVPCSSVTAMTKDTTFPNIALPFFGSEKSITAACALKHATDATTRNLRPTLIVSCKRKQIKNKTIETDANVNEDYA